MGTAQIKMWFKKISFILTGLLAALVFSGQSLAVTTLPYFKTYGGDVTTGGAFNSVDVPTACTSIFFQEPTPAKPNTGGIMAFVNLALGAGASAQQAAYSLGVVSTGSGEGGSRYGFFAGGDGGKKLTFANSSASYTLGGAFQDNTLAVTKSTNHCVPDYYKLKGGVPPGSTTASLDISGLVTNKYNYKAPAVTNLVINASSGIANSKNVTIFVSGNVFISNNITYAAGYNETNVPKFALVVKGNIYISKDVTQLDGFYIAQPDPTTNNDGEFWTCHDNSQTTPTGGWLYNNCGSKLTVNGAVVAKQVQLTRTWSNVESALPDELLAASNAAEIFNYTPEMVVGGAFFGQSSTNTGAIQRLVNLPPVF